MIRPTSSNSRRLPLLPVWDEPAVSPIPNLPVRESGEFRDLAASEREAVADHARRGVEHDLLLARAQVRPKRADPWVAEQLALLDPGQTLRGHRLSDASFAAAGDRRGSLLVFNP
jgi:hypothetical protein